MIRKSLVQTCFVYICLFAAVSTCWSESVQRQVNALLEKPPADDTAREERVNQLTAFGEEGAWVMVEQIGTKDLFRFMTLRAALIQMEATASPALRKYITQPPLQRARAAMSVLAEIADPGDLGFFLSQIDRPEWPLRAGSLRGIGKIGLVSATVEAKITPAIHDPDDSVRRYAVSALGSIGTRSAFDTLLKSLEDDSFFVRRATVRAIANLWKRLPPDEQSVASLLELTKAEQQESTQLLVIDLLGKSWRERAIKRLKELATDENWPIRAAAIRELKPIDPDWVKANRDRFESTDPAVRYVLNKTANAQE